MTVNSNVLFETLPGLEGELGSITLNRPAALNALNHEMILALEKHLVAWESDKKIKAVIIQAVPGRAFCAGGDVRALYEKKHSTTTQLAEFFIDEYRLNRHIFHYKKPYIALLNGITMGGGAGISIHSKNCYATPQLVFAMPETSIGFFPDVGSSFFLSRLPNSVGIYLGLTGAKLSYSDCVAFHLIALALPENIINEVPYILTKKKSSSKEDINTILKPYALPFATSPLSTHISFIHHCFSKPTIEEIFTALAAQDDEWAANTLAILKTKSPISLKITLKTLITAQTLSFDECIQMEARIAQHFLQTSDFFEGIRAMLVDKDRSPHWHPATLAEVTDPLIQKYFN